MQNAVLEGMWANCNYNFLDFYTAIDAIYKKLPFMKLQRISGLSVVQNPTAQIFDSYAAKGHFILWTLSCGWPGGPLFFGQLHNIF